MAKGNKKIPAKKSPKNTIKSAPAIQVAETPVVGRPSKYDPLFCKQAEKLCKLGATDTEMADFFQVAESTIYLWKSEHPEFSEAITRGKMGADMNVAASLYKCAVGFHYKETSIGTNDMGSFMSENKRYSTPDFRAIRFWLMNRQRDKWTDKVQQDITTKGESLNKPMTDEQFKQIVNMLNGADSGKGERLETAT